MYSNMTSILVKPHGKLSARMATANKPQQIRPIPYSVTTPSNSTSHMSTAFGLTTGQCLIARTQVGHRCIQAATGE